MALAGRWGFTKNGACNEHIPEITNDTVSCFFPSSNCEVAMQDGIWTMQDGIWSCVSRCVRVEVTLREVKKLLKTRILQFSGSVLKLP